MKRVVKGTLSAASVVSAAAVMIGAGPASQWIANAQDMQIECSDVIIVADGDPCTADSCDLIGETEEYCVYWCSHENICCW